MIRYTNLWHKRNSLILLTVYNNSMIKTVFFITFKTKCLFIFCIELKHKRIEKECIKLFKLLHYQRENINDKTYLKAFCKNIKERSLIN